MTITRTIDGKEIVIALTNRELTRAYFEQEHEWDKDFVSDELMSYDDETAMEEYGVTVEEMRGRLDEIAYAYRKYRSDYECSCADSLEGAFESVFNK